MAQPVVSNIEDPDERNNRLRDLGLGEPLIYDVVIGGHTLRQVCSPFDPPSFPPTAQWAGTHRALRQRLVVAGWTPDDTRNYSRVINPDRTIALAVATGDRNVGVVNNQYGEVQPHTKHPKGIETRLALDANLTAQMSLLDDVHPIRAPPPGSLMETWYLLLRTTPTAIIYELSRPRGQDKQRRIVSWWERILFPPIELTEAQRGPGDDDVDDDGPIDVQVERI